MKKHFLILLSALLFLSCESKIGLTPGLEEFDVTVEKSTVKVGEDVVFDFQGNPDLISFYSGEVYHQYDYREGRTTQVDSTILSISTSNPTLDLGQANQFSVLISSNYEDLAGDYSDITKAEWIDVTDRFTLSNSGFYVLSNANISDKLNGNKPFVVGFRYINKLSEGLPKRWLINNFQLIGKTQILGDIIIGSLNTASFRIVEQYPTQPSKSTVSLSQVSLQGADVDSGLGTIETWAISRQYSSGTLDSGPDRTIGVKGTDIDIDVYKYTYTKPGVYNVVFVAKNVNVDQEKEIIKEIQIIVEE